MVQVALLQGLTVAAADQAAAASGSGLPSGDASNAQQWIKHQANSLAAQTSLVHNLPESGLMFLPDIMTRVAHQAGPTAAAAAAAAGDGFNGDGGSGNGGSGGGGGGGDCGDCGDCGGDDPLDGMQADQQKGSGRREQSAPRAAYAAEGDQHLGRGNSPAPAEPVSWLEWEQQLQVIVIFPA